MWPLCGSFWSNKLQCLPYKRCAVLCDWNFRGENRCEKLWNAFPFLMWILFLSRRKTFLKMWKAMHFHREKREFSFSFCENLFSFTLCEFSFTFWEKLFSGGEMDWKWREREFTFTLKFQSHSTVFLGLWYFRDKSILLSGIRQFLG